MSRLPRLYAIADAAFGDPVEIAARLFAGGARLVQIRNKTAASRVLLEQVQAVAGLAPDGARVIVNDRADIALIGGAAGVHVGQGDLPPSGARRIVGPRSLVGVSAHDERQAHAAARQPVDYIAVGPVFPTATKKNASPCLGLDRLAGICQSLDRPVVAIGGIGLENIRAVLDAGADAVAVISDLIGHPEIEARTRTFLSHLN